MSTLDTLLTGLGDRFGVLADSDTNQLTVIARNTDVAIGDLFLLPCRRGADRFYVFRTTHYANVFNRTLEMNDVARNKLTMPDSYLADDLADEKLVQMTGAVLGYAEHAPDTDVWSFHRPRRLPQHLTDVYRVDAHHPATATVVHEMMASQLGDEGLFIGNLLAGEHPLTGVPVTLPPSSLSHHIGVFGRTGCGKSNLMMVLLRSALAHNRDVSAESRLGPRVSVFAIDPHDEFRTWHASSGGPDGLRAIVNRYTDEERQQLVSPFYYLTARNDPDGDFEAPLRLSRADVVPADLFSFLDFSEQQVAFGNQSFVRFGEHWIHRLLQGDTGDLAGEGAAQGADYLPGTISAVQRRLGFLSHGATRIFTRFDAEAGLPYDSLLPDAVCALEAGRVIVVDTTLISETEQFLLNTVAARTLFVLRRALRAADSPQRLRTEIQRGFGVDPPTNLGQHTLVSQFLERLEDGRLPYLRDGNVRPPSELPYVNVVVEEAPSILNPARMRFGSVFRDISRQGRKFGIGLTVVSQQVSEIDGGILTQLNTQITLALGNADERREAVRCAAADLESFSQELQVLARGQAILSTSFRDIALPIQVPLYTPSDTE